MTWRVSALLVLLVLRLIFRSPVETRSSANEPPTNKSREVLQERMVARVRQRLPEPEAGLVLGVVLGYKSSLSSSFRQALTDSGTTHIVVASGYNVMMVASLAMNGLLNFWRRREAVLGAIGVMIFYAWLTGGEVSVVRASFMGAALLWSSPLGRRTKAWWTLFLVAMMMLLFEPDLLGNVSFQLSVAATAGVVVVAPALQKMVVSRQPALWMIIEKLTIIPTMSAILLTMPIIWWHFGRASWISPIANLIILPVVPFLMASGAVMIGGSLLSDTWGTIWAWPSYALAHLIVVLVRFFG